MQKYLLGTAILSAAALFAGCSPAEVKPAPESIPNIPPGRGSAAAAGDAAGPAAPAGRTPAAPK